MSYYKERSLKEDSDFDQATRKLWLQEQTGNFDQPKPSRMELQCTCSKPGYPTNIHKDYCELACFI